LDLPTTDEMNQDKADDETQEIPTAELVIPTYDTDTAVEAQMFTVTI
jgi:hypothetical protein